jgi:transposase
LTPALQELCEWLKSEQVLEVAMESTGIYWIPIWNILEKENFKLLLVNPYFIKQVPGRKSDRKDAQWIAELLHKKLLRGSLVPSSTIRTLRSYSRAFVKKTNAITKVLTTMQRTLESANIHIGRMVTNINSKTMIKVITSIVHGNIDPNELIKLVHGHVIKRKGDQVLQSLQGYIRPEHQFLLGQMIEEHELLLKQANDLELKMIQLGEEYYKKEIELLITIPGIEIKSALQIMAETGGDMSAFNTSNKIVKWAGLVPRNDESAKKIKSKAITKGNPYLKRIIVQTAWSSSRTKGCHFQSFYRNLSFRKGGKKALIAVARKQLVVVWNLLTTNQPYDSSKQPTVTQEQLKARKGYYEKELKKINLVLE